MFCPNCGTENEEAATTCKKCGFNLKGAAAPKFKGTMLMMNSPNVPKPAGAPAAAPGAPPAGSPPAVAPAAAPRPQLKGTMLGVAPPSLGAPVPPAPIDHVVEPRSERHEIHLHAAAEQQLMIERMEAT